MLDMRGHSAIGINPYLFTCAMPAPFVLFFLRIAHELLSLARNALKVYWVLMRVMIPALIIVKALDALGATKWLAWLLSPVMSLLGLPESMGLVWATTLVTNIYTGMVVFFSTASNLTVAQVTVLGVIMLVAHALPVEGAIAKTAGMSWRMVFGLRLGGAVVLGGLLNLTYHVTGTLQYANVIEWQPAIPEPGLLNWAISQLQVIIMIFPVIFGLMLLLRILHIIGAERVLHILLSPVLKALGIGIQAANTTIIGIMLGLSYGGGLLIQEARSGTVAKRDILLTLAFLNLCHSLIEDTLLLVVLGSDLSGILWARLLFAMLVVGIIARLMPQKPVVSRQAPAH